MNRMPLVLLFLSCASAVVHADNIWVDAANTTGPWDGSLEHPYPFIQHGIDAAVDGDLVLVRDGTYTGLGNKNLDYAGRAITVQSENGPENCVIDCEADGRGFIFQSGETHDAILEGLTITNGYVDFGSPYGISGGGIMMRGGSPTISKCHIIGNWAAALGGGINCDTVSSPLLIDCTIAGNWADYAGGGIFCNGMGNDATIINCVIQENVAATADGGGVECGGNNTTLTNCLIAGNAANRNGGGIVYKGGDPPITNCTFIGNTAVQRGGAVFCDFGVLLVFTNCIFWGNTAERGPQIAIFNPTIVAISYSNVQGGQAAVNRRYGGILEWGAGNIDADPRFADPDGWDNDPNTFADNVYAFAVDSPCIDSGDNNAVPLDTAGIDSDVNTVKPIPFDLDDNLRFVDAPSTANTGVPGNGHTQVVDMGAYEFQALHIKADLNCDGSVDGEDIDPFFLAVGFPFVYEATFSTCEILNADVSGDGSIDAEDINPFFECLFFGGCP